MSKANSSLEQFPQLQPTEAANRTLLFGAGSAALLLFGVVMAVLGVMFGLPAVRERLHINFAQQGQLILLLYLGFLLADLLAGTLSDRFGQKWVLALSSFLVGAALAGLGIANSYGQAAGPIVLLGFGGGGINVASNALISEIFVERRGAAMNLAGAFYGVGALLVPLFVAVTGTRFSGSDVLWFTAAFAALCGVFLAALRFPRPRHKSAFSLLKSLQVARYPGLWVLMLLLSFQGGNEAAVAGWTSSYAGAAGHSPRAAAAVLACMWAAMIVGRTLASFAVAHLGKSNTILAGAGLGIVGCVLLLAVHSLGMLVLGAAVVGFSYGPIFQTALSVAGDRHPEAVGSVFGLLFATAVPGGMVWPWAMGQIAQNYSIRYGMLMPLAGAVGICVLTGAMRHFLGSSKRD
jgi:FHS family glucose/mannose:H+ symporter-like MFS transporter